MISIFKMMDEKEEEEFNFIIKGKIKSNDRSIVVTKLHLIALEHKLRVDDLNFP